MIGSKGKDSKMIDYSKFHPKPRVGNECKKTGCKRYKNYVAWKCGDTVLQFCTQCKNAHLSQYEKAK